MVIKPVAWPILSAMYTLHAVDERREAGERHTTTLI
jgi:hypothetical protein